MGEPRAREETAIAALISLSFSWVIGMFVWLKMPENSLFLDFGRFGCSFWIATIFLFLAIIAMKTIYRFCRGGRL